MAARTAGSRSLATLAGSGSPVSPRNVGQPENGVWLACRPSSTPIARGATTGRIGTPRAAACRLRARLAR